MAESPKSTKTKNSESLKKAENSVDLADSADSTNSEKSADSTSSAKEKKPTFRQEFIEFINRGSVVDLAVGVAVGGAFTAIVNSLVNDIVMPIVSLLGGGVNFSDLKLVIPNFFGGDSEAVIAYGNFLQNVVEFLIIAWVIFMIIKAMNRLSRMKEKAKESDAKLKAQAKEVNSKLKDKIKLPKPSTKPKS